MAQQTNGETLTTSKSSAHLLPATLGLSFLWPCMGSSATMHFRHAMAPSASLIPTQWHAVTMGAFYLLAVLLCFLLRKYTVPASRQQHVSRPSLALILGAAGLLGHVTLVFTPLASGEISATICTILGFALVIAFIAGSVFCWMSLLSRMAPQEVLLVAASSTALSYGTQLVVELMFGTGLLVFLVLCPAFHTVFFDMASKRHPDGFPRPSKSSRLKLPWAKIVPIVALIYLEQALTSLLFQRYSDWPRDNLALTLAAGFAIWLVVSLVIHWSQLHCLQPRHTSKVQARPVPNFMILFGALLVIYMAALFATVALPALEAPVAERLLVAAGSSFRTLLWAVLACAACSGAISPFAAGSVYIVAVLAIPVSRLASLAFSLADSSFIAELCSPDTIVGMTAGALFVVAASYVAASMRQSMRATTGATDSPTATPRGETASTPEPPYAVVAQEAGLSPRESEVLGLICTGYSARHASERLGISESTVVSHITHIYQKVGVANRQELIARVEEAANKNKPQVNLSS